MFGSSVLVSPVLNPVSLNLNKIKKTFEKILVKYIF